MMPDNLLQEEYQIETITMIGLLRRIESRRNHNGSAAVLQSVRFAMM
jgi:hypothetical protein